MAQRHPRKGTRAAWKRHKGTQEKVQGHPRKGTKAGNIEKAQGQARIGTRTGKKRHKDR
jgi:hypothetical protein